MQKVSSYEGEDSGTTGVHWQRLQEIKRELGRMVN